MIQSRQSNLVRVRDLCLVVLEHFTCCFDIFLTEVFASEVIVYIVGMASYRFYKNMPIRIGLL